MAVVSLKQFVEAGVHFGHQTRRWNPKMEKYIYGAKHGIHIIDLRQTLQNLKTAYEYTRKLAEEGRSVLFVGTKDQARDILVEEAQASGSYFINERWLGGLLTNFETVRQSVARLKEYEEMAGSDGSYEGMIKKEALQIDRKRQKLERSLGGVKEMQRLPGAIFIVDCMKEHIAVKEAQKLDIPIIAVVDTNCNPEGIDFPIPGNDDAPRAIRLYANVIATAVKEGKTLRKRRLQEEIIPEKNKPEESVKKAKKAPSEKAVSEPSPEVKIPVTEEGESKATVTAQATEKEESKATVTAQATEKEESKETVTAQEESGEE